MKDTTKAALFGASAAIAAAVSLPLIFTHQAQAQEERAAAPAARVEQYKVLSLVKLEIEGPARMDQELNKLAADGWRVRTGVGGAVILAR